MEGPIKIPMVVFNRFGGEWALRAKLRTRFAPLSHVAMKEVTRRCNDYPALQAKLDRAMGLLARYAEADSGIEDTLTSEAKALLAEHEKGQPTL